MRRRPCAQIWFGQEMAREVKLTRRGYLQAWPGRRFMYRTNLTRRWNAQRRDHNLIRSRAFAQKLWFPLLAASESPMKKIKAD